MSSNSRCGTCGVEKPVSEFYPDRSKRAGHGTVCKECARARIKANYWADREKYRAYNKAYYQAHKDKAYEQSKRLRAQVLEEYGGRCACCGEDTPEFLGIDHVNNDGEAHRRELKGYGRSIYQWLRINGFPKDGRFQLLCHNCNMAKGCYGGCPHNGPVPGRRHKTLAAA